MQQCFLCCAFSQIVMPPFCLSSFRRRSWMLLSMVAVWCAGLEVTSPSLLPSQTSKIPSRENSLTQVERLLHFLLFPDCVRLSCPFRLTISGLSYQQISLLISLSINSGLHPLRLICVCARAPQQSDNTPTIFLLHTNSSL